MYLIRNSLYQIKIGYKMVILTLIYSFIWLGLGLNIREHHCKSQEYKLVSINPDINHRLLQNSTPYGIRMLGHYIDSNTNQSLSLIKNVFGIASYYYQQIIKVTSLSQNNSIYPFEQGSCGMSFIPQNYLKNGFNVTLYDMVIFLLTENNFGSGYIAVASPCVLIRWPTYGYIQFNLAFLSTNLAQAATFHGSIYVTLHQMAHIMGLNSVFYSLYFTSYTSTQRIPKQKVVRTASSRSMIITPTVLAYVQNYFSCNDNTTGGLLEDQGGDGSAGSHWERQVYLDEMMTGSIWINGLKVSELTLSLFQDTGFYYSVDTTLGQTFTFGKGKGCAFALGITNNSSPQYCNSSSIACDFYEYYGGLCQSDQFSNSARYVKGVKNLICTYPENSDQGPNSLYKFSSSSRCFIGNFGVAQQTYCFEAKCGNNDTEVTINVNGNTSVCTAGTTNLNISGGTVRCPTSISSFCVRKTCDNWCSSSGFCLKGICLYPNTSAIGFVVTKYGFLYSSVLVVLVLMIV